MPDRARSTALALCLFVLFAGVPARAQVSGSDRGPSIEARLLEIIADARAQRGLQPYTGHIGLKAVAREHSREMADAGQLSHDGFEGRLERAEPDPSERNGAPDDGFYAQGLAGCENAAFRLRTGDRPEDDEEVAQGFFRQWRDSPSHADCLWDVWGYGLNAAGIGLYQDPSAKWWATMEVARDASPPGGRTSAEPTPVAVTPGPTPVPTPARTPVPTPVPTPLPTPAPTAEPAVSSPAAAADPTATAPPAPEPAPHPGAAECRFSFWIVIVDRCSG